MGLGELNQVIQGLMMHYEDKLTEEQYSVLGYNLQQLIDYCHEDGDNLPQYVIDNFIAITSILIRISLGTCKNVIDIESFVRESYKIYKETYFRLDKTILDKEATAVGIVSEQLIDVILEKKWIS